MIKRYTNLGLLYLLYFINEVGLRLPIIYRYNATCVHQSAEPV